MNFESMFKLTYLFASAIGGDVYDLFEPKLAICSKAYDSGDIETAIAMLNYLSAQLVRITEVKINA